MATSSTTATTTAPPARGAAGPRHWLLARRPGGQGLRLRRRRPSGRRRRQTSGRRRRRRHRGHPDEKRVLDPLQPGPGLCIGRRRPPAVTGEQGPEHGRVGGEPGGDAIGRRLPDLHQRRPGHAFGDARSFGDLTGRRLTPRSPPAWPAPPAPATTWRRPTAASSSSAMPVSPVRWSAVPLRAPVVAHRPRRRRRRLLAGSGRRRSVRLRRAVPGAVPPGRLNGPVVAAATYGDGYALAASDGGVFVFSDRPFHGSWAITRRRNASPGMRRTDTEVRPGMPTNRSTAPVPVPYPRIHARARRTPRPGPARGHAAARHPTATACRPGGGRSSPTCGRCGATGSTGSSRWAERVVPGVDGDVRRRPLPGLPADALLAGRRAHRRRPDGRHPLAGLPRRGAGRRRRPPPPRPPGRDRPVRLLARLLVNASLGRPQIWPVFVLAGAIAGFGAIQRPALQGLVPRLVDRDELTAAGAIDALVPDRRHDRWPRLRRAPPGRARPAGRLRRRRRHLRRLAGRPRPSCGPCRPRPTQTPEPPPGGEGLRYARSRPELIGTYLIDMAAMFFGMPMALFPALAVRYGGSAALGALYAAPSVGAFLATVTSGWTGRVHRHGRAISIAAAIWGLAIIGFGLAPWLWLALLGLAVAGRGRHGQRHLPDDDVEPDDPRPPPGPPGLDRDAQLHVGPAARQRRGRSGRLAWSGCGPRWCPAARCAWWPWPAPPPPSRPSGPTTPAGEPDARRPRAGRGTATMIRFPDRERAPIV